MLTTVNITRVSRSGQPLQYSKADLMRWHIIETGEGSFMLIPPVGSGGGAVTLISNSGEFSASQGWSLSYHKLLCDLCGDIARDQALKIYLAHPADNEPIGIGGSDEQPSINSWVVSAIGEDKFRVLPHVPKGESRLMGYLEPKASGEREKSEEFKDTLHELCRDLFQPNGCEVRFYSIADNGLENNEKFGSIASTAWLRKSLAIASRNRASRSTPTVQSTPSGKPLIPTAAGETIGAVLGQQEDHAQALLAIKKMAAGFFSGKDQSARAAGKILMAIESKVTELLIAKGLGTAN